MYIALGLLRSFAGTSWPAESRCQANRGINAVGFSKLTKYCDSFRFLKLFCVHFCWEGTLLKQNALSYSPPLFVIAVSHSIIFGSYILSVMTLYIVLSAASIRQLHFVNNAMQISTQKATKLLRLIAFYFINSLLFHFPQNQRVIHAKFNAAADFFSI